MHEGWVLSSSTGSADGKAAPGPTQGAVDVLSGMTREERAAYRARRARREAEAAARLASLAAINPFEALASQSAAYFRDKQWEKLAHLGRESLLKNFQLKRLLTIAGRGALYQGELSDASQLLDAACALYPTDCEAAFYRAVTHLRSGNVDEALEIFHLLKTREWKPERVRSEFVQALAAKLREQADDETILDELLAEVQEVIRSPGATVGSDVALLLHRHGHAEVARNLLDKLIVDRPDRRRTFEDKARLLVEQSRIHEAVTLSHEILKRWPDSSLAQFNIRVLGTIDVSAAPRTPRLAAISGTGTEVRFRLLGPDEAPETSASLEAALLRLKDLNADWLVVSPSAEDLTYNTPRLTRAVRDMAGIGYRKIDTNTALWHCDALIDLCESGLLEPSGEPLSSLSLFSRFYGTPRPRAERQGEVAVIMSRHGSVKFGGGEHFIASMADHYAELGYAPLIVGCRTELLGQRGEIGGHEYTHVENTPAAMRKLFFDRRASVVHSLSSIGYNVAQALRLTNIPFIYGIHYWSDALGHGVDDTFFDRAGSPIPRAEFSYIVARAQTVYANSSYTRQIIEQAHGLRCPIIFSVPEEVAS